MIDSNFDQLIFYHTLKGKNINVLLCMKMVVNYVLNDSHC